MKLIKKLFGGIDLTWPKLIVFAVLAGVYTAVMAILPQTNNTSFSDITATFECWILFGIIIITNSKSAKDAALKCFVFFLISQPLVYLIQVPFAQMGWKLFGYYPFWGALTVLTLPMGYIGYQMKQQKWWGLLILAPMLLILAEHANGFLSSAVYWFPRHLLSACLCIFTMFASVLGIFSDKKLRRAGLILCCCLTIAACALTAVNPRIYNTTLLTNNGSMGVTFDDTYKVSLDDPSHGEVRIKYEENLEDYLLDASFRKAGPVVLTLEAPDGTKRVFDVDVRAVDYDITERK